MPDSNHFFNGDLVDRFLSCDWGTSSFRLRLVEAGRISSRPLRILGELSTDHGIAATFELWKKAGKEEGERLDFYRSILEKQVEKLQEQLNRSPAGVALQDIPLILSGMASSSIGMKELPYKELPFNTDGKDPGGEILEATEEHRRWTLLISGVRSADDVMRGEETQLIGCCPSPGGVERIFIFPGTHSKHIRVKDGIVVDFKTYMTGEYFGLLSRHSILSGSVAESPAYPQNAGSPECAGFADKAALRSFEQGVKDSVQANLLHLSFLVRTNQLFGKMSKVENYYYLSGLLIGSECKDLAGTGAPLTLVCAGALRVHYSRALHKLGIKEVQTQDPDQAVIRGQEKIWAHKK